jgi:hypothetical protein
MQVLGITAETMWTKLGDRIGPERVEQMRAAVDTATGAWAFIKDVQGERAGGRLAVRLGSAQRFVGHAAQRGQGLDRHRDRGDGHRQADLDARPDRRDGGHQSFVAFFNAIESAIEYLTEILTHSQSTGIMYVWLTLGRVWPKS